jgi:HNH/ENDO VII superfamily nuclease with conserved GHE residues
MGAVGLLKGMLVGSVLEGMATYTETDSIDAAANATSWSLFGNIVGVKLEGSLVRRAQKPSASEAPTATTPTQASTPQGIAGTNAQGQLTSRGKFRVTTLDSVWQSAADGPQGGKCCPTCGKEVFGSARGPRANGWDVSHEPAWTRRLFPPSATRAQVLNNYQQNVFFECFSCNRSAGNRRSTPVNVMLTPPTGGAGQSD